MNPILGWTSKFPTVTASVLTSQPTRVFLDELPWDVRSKNTDWRYVRFDLPKLIDFEPSLALVMQTSRWITLRENARVLRNALGRRVGLPPARFQELKSSLSHRDLQRSGADVVFAHRAFPANAGRTPVIWQNCVLDPEMQISYGISPAEIEAEIAAKAPLYRQATAIQVSTEAEAARMATLFPDISDRFAAIPFFTPHVRACDVAALDRHMESGPVRLLFTGNDAWRKGLDLLLDAFTSLPAELRRRTELTIISNFVGRAVSIPNLPQITVLRGVGPDRVLQEMARAHIFVNVARFESYGLVFHEAMSQGLACLAPSWEVQRELFDYGQAGRLLPCDAEGIRNALEELIRNPRLRFDLAWRAWTRLRDRYAPAVVARKYAELFERVARWHAPASNAGPGGREVC